MYDIATHILDDTEPYPDFIQIETIRRKLLSDHQSIKITGHGAGSRVSKEISEISDLTRRSCIPESQGKWLFKLVRFFEPDTILELGSSFGISSMYLHLARPQAKMMTIEGNQEVAGVAENITRRLCNPSLQFKVGSFRERLPECLQDLGRVDLAFVDGDHQYESTLEYFEMFLPHMSSRGIVILDDIYWSPQMKRAWNVVREHSSISASIDLYYKGILLIGDRFPETIHESLIPFRWKPIPL